MKATLGTVKAVLKKKGYHLFSRPYELNIVGIRDSNVTADAFDDVLFVFWKDNKGKWDWRRYRITTDPGKVYLKSGLNGNKAISIVKEGQYKDAYAIGLHKKQYKALVQIGPVTALLDDDGNNILNFTSKKTKRGIFGLNIHRAKKAGTTEDVYLYSAGCQVFANASDFDQFMGLCERHRQKYSNKFTYTLIDEKAADRAFQKRLIVGALVLLALLYLLYYLYKKGQLQTAMAWVADKTRELQPH